MAGRYGAGAVGRREIRFRHRVVPGTGSCSILGQASKLHRFVTHASHLQSCSATRAQGQGRPHQGRVCLRRVAAKTESFRLSSMVSRFRQTDRDCRLRAGGLEVLRPTNGGQLVGTGRCAARRGGQCERQWAAEAVPTRPTHARLHRFCSQPRIGEMLSAIRRGFPIPGHAEKWASRQKDKPE